MELRLMKIEIGPGHMAHRGTRDDEAEGVDRVHGFARDDVARRGDRRARLASPSLETSVAMTSASGSARREAARIIGCYGAAQDGKPRDVE